MTALDALCETPFHLSDSPARARILSRLADTELSVALLQEPVGDDIELRLFDLPGSGRVALACDGEDRLAGFFGAPTDFVAMPGRVLAAVLRTEQVGLLVNPGQPSEMLLTPDLLAWLENALAQAPVPDQARLRLGAPDPEIVAQLAEPLGMRLGDLRHLITGAALAGVAGDARAQHQGADHVLVIAGAEPRRQDAIAKAMSETLAFLPDVRGGVDISFSETGLPTGALRFDLALPEPAPKKKGPPILR